ncbi:hypothetical protein B0T19DRAFT_113369 [Cercophora scortea]|uniref:Gfo/Idh/MocA-like oxidoreductase N-terminal domain-containing protein n=1 Tax=Cercophora scortea TaxID=314031 RepID=A0AAE0IX79_9PEZI|nr:hypothetical protein B0T19DRAFT_113369 [Cercophora scortea]
MAPIRVALIGLSASAKTSWASRAHLPYLLSPAGLAKFEIVALLNSSVAAAKSAIAEYNLPATTRAYGDPAALAADPDVDLVVCNTRVDKHAETIRPSLAAGKSVYSEWPLAQDAAHARDLAGVARESGARTVVGLQGRVAPLTQKVKELVLSGRIGKVLSSELRATGGSNDRDVLPPGLAYFTQREVGGNFYTIGVAHLFDLIQTALGEADPVQGHFQLQRPFVHIAEPASTPGGPRPVIETLRSNVPDLVFFTGMLPESAANTQKGATLHFRFRRGQPFPGDPALVWTINGEKGEIRVLSPEVAALQVGWNEKPIVVQVHDFATNTVEEVPWAWDEPVAGLPMASRNVALLYEAFAKGEGYPTFEDALARHEQLEGLLASWEA